VAQVVECLLCKIKAPSSNHSPTTNKNPRFSFALMYYLIEAADQILGDALKKRQAEIWVSPRPI
jgi:hypothetical protein